MRFHLLVPAIAATLISIQPLALAQPLTTFQPNFIDSIDITESDRGEGELAEQHSTVFEGQGKTQHLQIATSALSKQAVPISSANPFNSNFQAKLPGLTVSVDLPELQEWTQTQVSNIGTQIATVQAWNNNLVANTQEKFDKAQTWSMNVAADTQNTLDNIQEWSTELVSKIGTNLQNLQEWGTGLASNLKLNLFTLSKEFDRIEQEIEATGNPEEIAEIQKAKQMKAILSEELDEIQKDLDQGATSDEIVEIQKAEAATATLSEELDEIQKELGKDVTPEEIAEIQKVEQMTANVSEELGEIQQAAETTAILSEKVSGIEKTPKATENVVNTVTMSEIVAETEEETKVSQEIENPELRQAEM